MERRKPMSKSIHHIAIVVHDLDSALTLYRDVLGLEVVDRWQVPQDGVEIVSLATDSGEIELLMPIDSESSAARFLEKRGEGLHHVCLSVDDINAEMERLVASGARLLSKEPLVNAHGTRLVFIHPKSAHGVLLELYEGS
jgi:methylmalonyl-CoA/ethylmalonyl-CoA epimerase